MFYKKTGLPEESELVMCTISNIQYSTVFAKIDSYGISGMIHISEIAAGRIRNIRDYVKEGKKVVCKVLRVDKFKGHVDLSLRRVSDSQRRSTVNDLKLEQKAESIIDYIAKQHKLETKKLYSEMYEKLKDDYELLHHAFEDVVTEELDLSEIVDKKLAKEMTELVILRFKPKRVEISGVLELSTYDGDGLEIVKSALKKAEADENVDIRYLGGGKYSVVVDAVDYKEAEGKLKEASDAAIEIMQKHNGTVVFTRKDKK